jgi:hypothetical protein
MCEKMRIRVARTLAMGAAWYPVSPEGGVRHLSGGGSVRHTADNSWASCTVKAWADKYYNVMVGDKCERISIDRLKPYTGGEQLEVTSPPRRGRPRKN